MPETSASYESSETKPHRRHTEGLALRVTSFLALAGLFVTGVSSSVTETEASWTNSEQAVASEVTAMTVNPPRDLRCEGVVFRRLEWEEPLDDGPPEDGYLMEVTHVESGDTEQVEIEDGSTTSVRLTGGLFTFLWALLFERRGTYHVRILVPGPGEWTGASEPTSFRIRTLGTPTCT